MQEPGEVSLELRAKTCDQCKNPGRRAWNWVTVLICTHLLESMDTRLGLRHQEECEYVEYNQPRNRPRALRGGASGRRSATSEHPGNPRELRLREEIRLDKREFYLILRYVMTVDEYVIAKMIAEVEATS